MNIFEAVLYKASLAEQARRDAPDAGWWKQRRLWVDDTPRRAARNLGELHNVRPTEDSAIHSIKIAASGIYLERLCVTVQVIQRPVLWRFCFACKEWKPPSAFRLNGRGDVASYCNNCAPVWAERVMR